MANINMDCQCPTYNKVVFPQVHISRDMKTFKNGDYETGLQMLHVKIPKNFAAEISRLTTYPLMHGSECSQQAGLTDI